MSCNFFSFPCLLHFSPYYSSYKHNSITFSVQSFPFLPPLNFFHHKIAIYPSNFFSGRWCRFCCSQDDFFCNKFCFHFRILRCVRARDDDGAVYSEETSNKLMCMLFTYWTIYRQSCLKANFFATIFYFLYFGLLLSYYTRHYFNIFHHRTTPSLLLDTLQLSRWLIQKLFLKNVICGM